MITLTKNDYQSILNHAQKELPNEACGLIAGTIDDQGNKIIKNKEFESDFTPLDSKCNCYACTHHTRAYIRHLFRVQEATAAILLSIHNVHFLINFANQIRESILEGTFEEFYNRYVSIG